MPDRINQLFFPAPGPYGGPRMARMRGGPVNAAQDFTDTAGSDPGSPTRQVTAQYTGMGMPYLAATGGYVVNSPIQLAYRLPPRLALDYLTDGAYLSPYQPIVQSGVAGPGPQTIVVSNPDINTRADVVMWLLELSAPPLTSLPQALVQLQMSGFDRWLRPMAFTDPAAAAITPGTFRLRTNGFTKGMSILVIPFHVINSKPRPAAMALCNEWDFGGGFAAPVTTEFTVDIDGAPDGSQLDITAVTLEHPVGNEALRLLYEELNSVGGE